MREEAEAWVCKMKVMTVPVATKWLAENDFINCNGKSKEGRASQMCIQIHSRSNKRFEAKFDEEVKCILHENAMQQNIQKHQHKEHGQKLLVKISLTSVFSKKS